MWPVLDSQIERQAEKEEMGAMESAGAGVWPGLVAEPGKAGLEGGC